MKMNTNLQLNSGENKQIPIIGLGTWQASAQEIEDIVTTALDSGYRHIDTAFNYNNEEAIGNALKNWFEKRNTKREDVFITTKLPCFGNRSSDVERFLKLSLKRLQLNYVDLYLIHMPFGFVCDEATLTPAKYPNGEFQLDKTTDHLEIWKAMEEQVRNGLAKNIGLSNFNATQIQNIYEHAIIKPSVLQVELHAFLQQTELRNICKKLGIIITAFAPLGSPAARNHMKNKYNFHYEDYPNVLGHPIVVQLAGKYKKTPGQILLRFLIEQDIVVIPKSSNQTRLQENITIFDFKLMSTDMDVLKQLDQGEKGRIFNFLFFNGIQQHPEYPFHVL